MPKTEKPETPTKPVPQRIGIPQSAREKIGPMIAQINQYMQGVRDALGVPKDWIAQQDPNGVPLAFVPRPEMPQKTEG